MTRTPNPARPPALVLRTAALWGTFVVGNRDLRPGQSLELGDDPRALATKPDQSPAVDLPIVAVGSGWELDARGATGGILHLRGRQEDPAELGRRGALIPIVAGDYGVLQYGSFSVFFQFARPAPVPSARWRPDVGLLLAFLFAIITLGGGLMLLYMLFPKQELPKPLELTSAAELEVKYRFTPPPEAPPSAETEGGGGAKRSDPKTAAGSAKRAPGPTRRSPEPAAAAPGAPAGLSAMTDVMQGAVGKEVLETLGTISSVSEALGELGSSGVVLGGQSGGFGLRAGGGGDPGGAALFGAGTLDTGSGSGAGLSGRGRGRARAGKAAGGRGGERRLAAAAAAAPGQGLSPDQVSRVVRARAGAFRACYESAAARAPKLQGGLTVSFTVSPAGSVSARISNSTLGNARVEGCVLRTFNRLRFPAADKPTSANWPLVFRPGKG